METSQKNFILLVNEAFFNFDAVHVFVNFLCALIFKRTNGFQTKIKAINFIRFKYSYAYVLYCLEQERLYITLNMPA